MAQLVFEFVSRDIDTIAAAIHKVAGLTLTGCQLAREYLNYEPCTDFELGISQLRAGNAVSLIARPDSRNIRYALVNAPYFNGAKLASWLGTIEYTDTAYGRVWDDLLSLKGLQLLCLGFEEGVELDGVGHLVYKEFPWADRRQIIGAVRTSTGAWDIRQGTNYFPST